MACEQPCFDCPFMRGAESLDMDIIELIDLVHDHFTEDGGYQSYPCEEQGDTCFGQLQVIANGLKTGLDEFSEIGEAVSKLKSNTKDFYQGPWEFIPVHEA